MLRYDIVDAELLIRPAPHVFANIVPNEHDRYEPNEQSDKAAI